MSKGKIEKDKSPLPPEDPSLRNHVHGMHIEAIEGIVISPLEKLRFQGRASMANMIEEGLTRVGRARIAERTGVGPNLILQLVERTYLMRITGIGESFADLLEAAGVDSVPELAHRNADNLYEKILEVNQRKTIVRKLPSRKQVGDWIDQAKQIPKHVTY